MGVGVMGAGVMGVGVMGVGGCRGQSKGSECATLSLYSDPGTLTPALSAPAFFTS